MPLSELTLSLIAVGALVLGGMVAHSAWQARKAGPRRPDPPAPRVSQEPVMGEMPPAMGSPVLLDPGLDHDVEGSPSRAAEGAHRIDVASPDGAAKPAPVAVAGGKPPRYVPRIDALVDAIVPISLEAALSGEALLPYLPVTRRAGSKPFLVEAFNLASGEWEQPMPGARYSELQAGILLANRGGPLNEIEYSEFVQKIEAFAQSVGGMADFPDMLEVVGRARELDAFASQHDAQLAVHLRARGTAWSVGYVQQHASRHGFVSVLLSGRMVLPALEEGAPPVLTLHFDPQAALAEDPNQAALRTVTLSFDVPQSSVAQDPFGMWQECARALALSMEAFIVDDAGQTLSDEGFEAISKELARLYEALDKRDLAAGSMAARRLFS